MAGDVYDACTIAHANAWLVPPDARCDEHGCDDDCDGVSDASPRPCNAWRVEAGFSAQAVSIAESH